MTQPSAARSPTLEQAIGIAAGLYLVLQLGAPLWVLARGELTSRDFSWDMFSYHLSCSTLNAVVSEGGEWQSLRLDHDFASWAQLRRALSAERFAAYARGVCDSELHTRGRTVQLRLLSECQSDRGQPPFAVLDPDRDFCRAP